MNGDELLQLAEHYLATRDYETLRHVILTSPLYHPTNLTATRILTLINTLTTRPDYYYTLSLTRFTSNPTLIKTRFKTLATLLNPNTNPLSLAPEAFRILIEAHSVLSDSDKKRDYDNWLKMEGTQLGKNQLGFWTMCPYCYYVYEYEKVYKDCCMRCQNEECRKGYTAVEIRVPPPETVAGSGKYLCLGFKGVGFKGFSSWSPFSTGFEDVGEEEVDGIRVEKMGIKRRKSVGVCAKKVMGKGVRVQRDRVDGIFGGL